MNVVLTNSEETSSTLKIIFEELSIIPSDYGTEVKLIKGNGPLKIISSEKKVTIYYKEIPHLFRGLTQWCNRIGENFSLVEAPQFESIGPMIDLSRNAVMSIPALKRFITLCSKMGLNSIMLYMEDVYSIPEYPFFGYSRGKYSQEELKELDSFSQLLGVELIPAIQTLAHLANPLKWRFANGIKDTEDILLVGAPETYTFLNAAIKSIADTFHTKKIHIGMDEAHNLGRGHYLDEHGLEDPFNIMRKHLSEVKKICDTYELSPMMWSDMFFRIGSASGDYYDLDVNFPDSLVNDIPDIDMVYWDYYHHKTQEYDQQIKNHKLLKRPIIFAGGIWTFNGLAPNYGKTIETTQAGLESAKKNGVKTIFATLWGDDGAETPLISGLLGLQLFSEHQFSATTPTIEDVTKQFSLFHDLDADDFLILNAFDQTDGVASNNPHGSNVSKLILYQDILFGLYEKTISQYDLYEDYQILAERLQKVTTNKDTEKMFAFYKALSIVLPQKLTINHAIQSAYQNKDLAKLNECMLQIEILKKDIQNLHFAHRDVWFEWNKPFGFEVIDLRYGSLIARCDMALWRISEFLTNKIDTINELEIETYIHPNYAAIDGIISRDLFKGIYSASKLSDV